MYNIGNKCLNQTFCPFDFIFLANRWRLLPVDVYDPAALLLVEGVVIIFRGGELHIPPLVVRQSRKTSA